MARFPTDSPGNTTVPKQGSPRHHRHPLPQTQVCLLVSSGSLGHWSLGALSGSGRARPGVPRPGDAQPPRDPGRGLQDDGPLRAGAGASCEQWDVFLLPSPPASAGCSGGPFLTHSPSAGREQSSEQTHTTVSKALHCPGPVLPSGTHRRTRRRHYERFP